MKIYKNIQQRNLFNLGIREVTFSSWFEWHITQIGSKKIIIVHDFKKLTNNVGDWNYM